MTELDEKNVKNGLLHYHYADAAFRDVMNTCNQYKGLKPIRDKYTFNDGTKLNLVNLTGTIPVRYKGSTYNIPITVWLMDTHPKNAPICYVKPTPDMSIKVSQFVDHNGKIYLPYLHDWIGSQSDLVGLIQVMVVTFGEQPPVFARRSQEYPMYKPPTYPPMPSAGGPGYPQATGGPGYPPYPTQSGAASSMPYMPPYPPSGGVGAPYPTPGAGAGPNWDGGSGNMPMSGMGQSGGGQGAGTTGTGTIREEHLRESLISAIEDKLMRRMKEQMEQSQAELETLRHTQTKLQQGKAQLDATLNKLTKEKSDLDKYIAVLKDKEDELDKAIERLNNQENIDVDDAVITTAPLYKQLLNAFAEEAAIEDAIYNMGEALNSQGIDIDTFLKQVRTLSRKQFMLRALMQKCRQKAGLAPV